ncbi:MAG: hypothetical protein ABS36_17110 [Acidobacteria bacterium SCN 69-37]|nr:MAG: hypothetical protein ABS36_17110 [Acidobacteria bacterium SCN 69-37]
MNVCRFVRVLVCVCVAACATPLAWAQPAAPPAEPATPGTRLRVYVEACHCFEDFLRDAIAWVDFVRQPQDADLQILGTTVQTGAGGAERTLRFVGAGRYAGSDFSLRAVTIPGEPEDGQRRTVLSTIQVGLLTVAARDGIPAGLRVDVAAPAVDTSAAPARDPWNFWVLELGAEGGIQAEETRRETEWEVSVQADRVTRDWLVDFRADVEAQTESFDLDDDDERGRRVEVTRREWATRLFLARSLGRHWSAGVDSDVQSSTFGNVELSTQVTPALEYSVFPYSEYATRQLRLEYGVGVIHARYNEVTLFGRLRETRPRHLLAATLQQRQPWGSIESRVEWSQYLHDPGLSRLEFDGEVSLRLIRGLSLDIGGSASRIRDQISLPGRGATPEEVLLRVRELQSGYEIECSIGLSYTFGSIFNNIVNPRFGRN